MTQKRDKKIDQIKENIEKIKIIILRVQDHLEVEEVLEEEEVEDNKT
jgi:hypothetical protein